MLMHPAPRPQAPALAGDDRQSIHYTPPPPRRHQRSSVRPPPVLTSPTKRTGLSSSQRPLVGGDWPQHHLSGMSFSVSTAKTTHVRRPAATTFFTTRAAARPHRLAIYHTGTLRSAVNSSFGQSVQQLSRGGVLRRPGHFLIARRIAPARRTRGPCGSTRRASNDRGERFFVSCPRAAGSLQQRLAEGSPRAQ